jgi:hypothetical protein
MRLQRLVELAASSARRDTEYDFPSFSALRRKIDQYDTGTAIHVLDGRVCALIVSRERECEYVADLTNFEMDFIGAWRPTKVLKIEKRKRRTIEMIWVLKSRRRQGIAGRLIRGFAEHHGLRIEEMAHMLPFREDALRLWIAMGYAMIYIV